MIRVVIEYDPATGGLRLAHPEDRPLALYVLELARDAIKARATASPVVLPAGRPLPPLSERGT